MNLQTLTVTPLSWNQAHNKKLNPLISIHRVHMYIGKEARGDCSLLPRTHFQYQPGTAKSSK